MYIQSLEEETIMFVESEERFAEWIKSDKYISAEPSIIAKQLFGYMSDNDEAQLKNDITDFLDNPKKFVRYYLEEVLCLELNLHEERKWLYIHSIEGELMFELIKRNLIKRAWVANV